MTPTELAILIALPLWVFALAAVAIACALWWQNKFFKNMKG